MRPIEKAAPFTAPTHRRLRDPDLLIIAAMVFGITLLHYLTDAQLVPYHSIYRSLYYIPIAIAAVRWGMRGGIGVAIVICVVYLPHVIIALHGTTSDIDALLECSAFLFVAALTGYLADAERHQRRRAQEAAIQRQAQAEEAERMRASVTSILESIDSGVITVDHAGRVMTTNYAARALFASDTEASIALPDAIQDYLSAGAQGYQQFSHQGRTLELHSSPLRGAQGERLGAVLVLEDLTERRVLEEQMRRAERLAALGRLAGGLAHELRNPLSITRAAAQMLQQELDHNDKSSEYTRVIQGEIDRVDRLVEQLLTYARPRPLQRALVDLAALVEQTSGLARVYAKQHGVTLKTRVAEGLPAITGDSDLLHQAVVNALFNSIQATPLGGVVSLDVQQEQDEALLIISDNGHGIPADILPHIFDPFFTTRDDGAGLGLSIVQQIIHDHGGAISVQSEPGQGTRVVLRLPGVPAMPSAQHSRQTLLKDPGM